MSERKDVCVGGGRCGRRTREGEWAVWEEDAEGEWAVWEEDAGRGVATGRHARDGVDEPGAEDDVGVVEHALLERDDEELRLREVRLP